jgi:hypothetical protein
MEVPLQQAPPACLASPNNQGSAESLVQTGVIPASRVEGRKDFPPRIMSAPPGLRERDGELLFTMNKIERASRAA